MNLLALDVGLRRTGVAFADTITCVPVSLQTIHHTTFDELFEALELIIKEKAIKEVVLGLPLLPSGEEGEQVAHVQAFAELLSQKDIPHCFIDERYTSVAPTGVDENAAAACRILEVKLAREGVDK